MNAGEKKALDAVARIYRHVDADLRDSGECSACGKCCRFETFGHRLYVTYVEARYLLEVSGQPQGRFGPDECGYQSGSECLAREGRPLGCRTFFCGDCGGGRMEVHESALEELRAVCLRSGTPWGYRRLHENMALLLGESFTEVQ